MKNLRKSMFVFMFTLVFTASSVANVMAADLTVSWMPEERLNVIYDDSGNIAATFPNTTEGLAGLLQAWGLLSSDGTLILESTSEYRLSGALKLGDGYIFGIFGNTMTAGATLYTEDFATATILEMSAADFWGLSCVAVQYNGGYLASGDDGVMMSTDLIHWNICDDYFQFVTQDGKVYLEDGGTYYEPTDNSFADWNAVGELSSPESFSGEWYSGDIPKTLKISGAGVNVVASTAPAASAEASKPVEAKANTVAPTFDPNAAFIATTDVNVRASASASSTALGYISRGNGVAVIEQSGKWYKVQFGEKTGYVSASYVVEKQSVDLTNTTAKTVNASSLNVRSGAGVSNGVVGVVKSGETVYVIETVGNWSKIDWYGNEAYVYTSYLY